MDYRTVQLFDETTMDTQRVYRSDWYGLDEMRIVEWQAAQLVDHDYQSAIVWIIVEERMSSERRAWEAERERLLHIYSQWRYFVNRFKGMATKAYIEATAKACSVAVGEVKRALMLVEAHGLMPEVA